MKRKKLFNILNVGYRDYGFNDSVLGYCIGMECTIEYKSEYTSSNQNLVYSHKCKANVKYKVENNINIKDVIKDLKKLAKRKAIRGIYNAIIKSTYKSVEKHRKEIEEYEAIHIEALNRYYENTLFYFKSIGLKECYSIIAENEFMGTSYYNGKMMTSFETSSKLYTDYDKVMYELNKLKNKYNIPLESNTLKVKTTYL